MLLGVAGFDFLNLFLHDNNWPWLEALIQSVIISVVVDKPSQTHFIWLDSSNAEHKTNLLAADGLYVEVDPTQNVASISGQG